MLNATNNKLEHTHYTAYLALLLASILYGGNTVAGRIISQSIPPFTLSMFRAISAFVFLLPIAWPVLRKARKPNRKELLGLMLISVLSISIPYTFFTIGLKYTTGTNTSIIYAAIPALTNFLLFLIARTRPSKQQALGIAISFLGLIIVFTQGNIAHLSSFQFGKGEIYIFINIFAISLANIFGQKMMKTFPSVVVSIYSALFACITLIPIGVWQSQSLDWHLSWSGWLVVLYMGFCVAGIAYFLNFYGVSRLGSGPASIFGNLNPVFGIGLCVLILKETVGIYHLVGFALVISGVVLSLKKSTPSQNSTDPALQEQSI